MLDADVDSLLNVPVANTLVYYDSHCGFGDIVDDAGFAVVDFVWHAEQYQESSHFEELKIKGTADPF